MTHSPLKQTKKRVMASDKLSGNSSTLNVRAMRTPPHAVEVVHSRNGWFINLSVGGSPTRCYGPLEGPINIGQALIYVGTLLNINNE